MTFEYAGSGEERRPAGFVHWYLKKDEKDPLAMCLIRDTMHPDEKYGSDKVQLIYIACGL